MYFQMYSPSTTKYFAKSLFEAGVEFIARAGSQWSGKAGIALGSRHEIIDHGVVASVAGQDQVLVKRRFQDAGVRKPQHRVGALEIVCDPHARLGLAVNGDAIVEIAAQPEVEHPILYRNGVLSEQGQFFDIRVTTEGVQAHWSDSGNHRRPAVAPFGSSRSRPSRGTKAGFAWSGAVAIRRIGQRRVGVGTSVRVKANRVKGGIDDPEGVVFRQKGVLEVDSRLQVVDAFHVRDSRARPGVGERAILANGLELKIRRKVGKGVRARVIVILIAAEPSRRT